MAEAQSVIAASDRLLELARRLEAHQGFSEVVACLEQGRGASLEGVWGSACALVSAALVEHATGPLVVVCPQQEDMDRFCDDLALFTVSPAEKFPAWESEPVHQVAGYVLRGDEDAYRNRAKATFPDVLERAWAWIWRPRFVKPKGPEGPVEF